MSKNIISLKELARTGKLGPVYITMSSERVEELLGKPDFTGGGSRKNKWENIWRYGDLELIFDQNTRTLEHIGINYPETDKAPEQGENLFFDSWIFIGGLETDEFKKNLRVENIQFEVLKEPWNKGCKEYHTEGGMHVIFGLADDDYTIKGLRKFVVGDYAYS